MKAMARRPREDYQLPLRATLGDQRSGRRCVRQWIGATRSYQKPSSSFCGALPFSQGDFTINAAAAVATDERIGTADVFETIANLAAKSLISTDISSDVTYHRLPPPEDPGHHRDLYKLSLTVPRF
jgi:hypothetical protein